MGNEKKKNVSNHVSGVKRCRIAFSPISDDDDDDESDNVSIEHRRRRKRRKKDKSEEEESENNDEDLPEGEYFVESVQGHKRIGDKKYKYNIKWKGYVDLTWEPPENLNEESLNEYWRGDGARDKEAAMDYFISKEDAMDEDSDDDMMKRSNSISEPSPKQTDKKKKRRKKKKKVKNESVSVNGKEEKVWRCEPCNRTFVNGWAYGGHCASKHPKNKKKNTAKK